MAIVYNNYFYYGGLMQYITIYLFISIIFIIRARSQFHVVVNQFNFGTIFEYSLTAETLRKGVHKF